MYEPLQNRKILALDSVYLLAEDEFRVSVELNRALLAVEIEDNSLVLLCRDAEFLVHLVYRVVVLEQKENGEQKERERKDENHLDYDHMERERVDYVSYCRLVGDNRIVPVVDSYGGHYREPLFRAGLVGNHDRLVLLQVDFEGFERVVPVQAPRSSDVEEIDDSVGHKDRIVRAGKNRPVRAEKEGSRFLVIVEALDYRIQLLVREDSVDDADHSAVPHDWGGNHERVPVVEIGEIGLGHGRLSRHRPSEKFEGFDIRLDTVRIEAAPPAVGDSDCLEEGFLSYQRESLPNLAKIVHVDILEEMRVAFEDEGLVLQAHGERDRLRLAAVFERTDNRVVDDFPGIEPEQESDSENADDCDGDGRVDWNLRLDFAH